MTIAASCIVALLATHGHADGDGIGEVEAIVDRAIWPVMQCERIPGMAVGVVRGGASYVFNYGTASKATSKPVTDDTLFEVGSVSKTFTATLAAYAQASGQLSFADPVSKYLSELHDSPFGEVSLLNLSTHTPGGLPLQVPDDIKNDEQLMAYLKQWKPTYPPGTYRTYANPSIGLLGRIAAKSLKGDFVELMEGKLFPALGLKSTFLNVPANRMDDYAQGYTESDDPIRLTSSVLGSEAYGIRTTASDLLLFVEANMEMRSLDETWQRAITDTHTGYYRLDAMTQDLIWEQYADPVTLKELLAGNSGEVIMKANPVVKLDPSSVPEKDVLINKTGSTNGFSTYVVFLPARGLAVILLANKRYPIEARVAIAWDILQGLEHRRSKN